MITKYIEEYKLNKHYLYNVISNNFSSWNNKYLLDLLVYDMISNLKNKKLLLKEGNITGIGIERKYTKSNKDLDKFWAIDCNW